MDEEISTSASSPVVSHGGDGDEGESETNGTALEKTNKSEAVWQPCWDAGTGSYYYWNVVTNETTWTRPPASSLYSSTYPASGNNTNGVSTDPDYRASNPEAYPGFDPLAAIRGGGGAGTLVIPTATLKDTSLNNSIGTDVVDAFFENIERVKRQRLDSSQNDVSFSGGGAFQAPGAFNAAERGVEEEQEEEEEEGEETDKIIKEFEEKYGYNKLQTAELGAGAGGYTSKGRYNPLTGVFEADPQLVGPERFSASARMQRQCDFFFDYQAYALQRGLDPEAGKVKMSKKELARAIRRSKVKREMKKKKWLLGID